MDILSQPPMTGNPPSGTVSLSGLLDLLDVLEAEVNGLPEPAPLLTAELRLALAEALGVAGDGH